MVVLPDAVSLMSSPMGPQKPPKVLLNAVNPHITCFLCQGYLIDATTIVECLHSFCHSCIMGHLMTENYCPQCEMMINKAKPNIKPDATLQAIVYKLVPGLYEKELLRKRAFYRRRPQEAMLATPEQRGEDTEHLIFGPAEKISLSLEYADIDDMKNLPTELVKPKYLQCPAVFKVELLKKFVVMKFGIDFASFNVDIMYKVKTIVLPDYYTLMDVAYIYTWKREAPMRFYFRVRTKETTSEELPEVALRRSPNIMNRQPVSTAISSSTDVSLEPSKPTNGACKLQDSNGPSVKIVLQQGGSTDNANHPDNLKMKEEKSGNTSSLDISVTQQISDGVNVVKESLPEKAGKSNKNNLVNGLEKVNKCKSSKSVNKGEEIRKVEMTSHDKISKDNIVVKVKKEKAPSTSQSHQSTMKVKKEDSSSSKCENIKLKIGLSKDNSGMMVIKESSTPQFKEPMKVKQEKRPAEKEASKKLEIPVKKIKQEILSPMTEHKDLPIVEVKLEDTKLKGLQSSKSNKENAKIAEEQSVKKEIQSEIPKDVKEATTALPSTPTPTPSPSETEEAKKSQFLNSFQLTAKKSISGTKNSVPSKNIQNLKQASKRKSKEPMKSILKTCLEAVKTDLNSKFRPETARPRPKSLLTTAAGDDTKKNTISFALAPYPIGSTENGEMSSKDGRRTVSPAVDMIQIKKDDSPLPRRKFSPFVKIAPKESMLASVEQKLKIKKEDKANVSPQNLIMSTSFLSGLTDLPFRPAPVAKSISSRRQTIATENQSKYISVKDTAALLKRSDTEIRQIDQNNKDVKVYGPAMTPPHSKPSNSGSKTPSHMSEYLNLALMNASSKNHKKSFPSLASPYAGMRSPVYTPNSPIYSPNSPQYTPNYNIPTQPTYKYIKVPTYVTNFVPPQLNNNNNNNNNNKKDRKSSMSPTSRTSPNSNPLKKPSDEDLKRKRSKSKSPLFVDITADDQPQEKQRKVQSVLDSCNFSFPSSLSITLANDQSDSASSDSGGAKLKSPVNNYIEILKLPSDGPATDENKNTSSMVIFKSDGNKNSEFSKKDLLAKVSELNTKAMAEEVKKESIASPSASTEHSLSPNNKVEIINNNAENSPTKNKQVPNLNPIDKNDKLSDSFQHKFLLSILAKDNYRKQLDNTIYDLNTTKTVSAKPVLTKTERVENESPSASPPLRQRTPPLDSPPTNTSASKEDKKGKIKVKVEKQLSQKSSSVLDLSSPPSAPSLSSLSLPPPTAPSALPSLSPPSPPSPPSMASNNQNNKVTSSSSSCDNYDKNDKKSKHVIPYVKMTPLIPQKSSNGGSPPNFLMPHNPPVPPVGFSPHLDLGIQFQQAYWLGQVARMKKAGHDALENYLHYLKQNAAKNPSDALAITKIKENESKF